MQYRLKNILNGVVSKTGTTTEFINCQTKLTLHFNQNDGRGCELPMFKSALQRVCIKFELFAR